MNDMASAIIPKSDQLNSDDLISGPITIKITGVTIKGGQEQPVSIHYEGDNGKPYKSCKSMNRVIVTAWGADSKNYVGRSMTLYRDPSVKWAGMEVGGIRISHMSHIDSAMTMALTMTKQNRKPFTVRPLQPSSAPQPTTTDASSLASGAAGAEPTDESIVAEIGTWVKRKKFEMAHDLCRSIKDVKLQSDTAAKILNAEAFVKAKETQPQ